MNFYYYIKTQPKLAIKGVIIYVLMIFVSIVFFQDYTTWKILKASLILLPIFFTANTLSDDIEQSRDGMLFTARKPIYQQMLLKFTTSWLFCQILLLILFSSAYITGMETSFMGWLVILINSTFLSLLGLTAGNLSRHTLVGYSIPLGYWVVQMMAGLKINEAIAPLSVILNLELTRNLHWGSMQTLAILSVILMMFNLWYVSKGEGLRRYLLLYTLPVILLLVLIGGGIFYYHDLRTATIQTKIIQGSPEQRIIVLDNVSPVVAEYLQEHGYSFFTPEELKATDWVDHHLIWIAETDSQAKNEMRKHTDLLEVVQVIPDGVQLNEYCVSGGKAFRMLLTNPVNVKKYVIYFESAEWNPTQLALLFKEERGNILIVDDKDWLVKSNYSTEHPNLSSTQLNLNEQTWLMAEADGVEIRFRNISIEHIEQFLAICSVVQKELRPFMPTPLAFKPLQIYYKNPGKLDKESYRVEVRSKRDLQPKREGGRDWVRDLSMVYLNPLLINIEDSNLRYSWANYLLNTRLLPAMQQKLGDLYMFGDLNKLHSKSQYLADLEALMKTERKIQYYDVASAGAAILYTFEKNSGNLVGIIREIAQEKEALAEEIIIDMLGRYINSLNLAVPINLYHEANEDAKSFKAQRRVRK